MKYNNTENWIQNVQLKFYKVSTQRDGAPPAPQRTPHSCWPYPLTKGSLHPAAAVTPAEPALRSSLHLHPYTLQFSFARFIIDINGLMYI